MIKSILKSTAYMYIMMSVVSFTLNLFIFVDALSLYFAYIIVTAGICGGIAAFLLDKEPKNDASRK